jgi:hypothetical protein
VVSVVARVAVISCAGVGLAASVAVAGTTVDVETVVALAGTLVGAEVGLGAAPQLAVSITSPASRIVLHFSISVISPIH